MTGSPPRDVAIGIIFLSQTMIGILDNFFLLYQYLFFYHTECRIRAMDLIHKHPTIANFLVILSNGVPQAIAAFRLKRVFSDFARKLLLYVHRAGRGLSISTVCLLSVFQAITISPMNSCWKDLKVKAPPNVGFCVFLFWTQYTFVNLIFPMYTLYMISKWSMTNITETWGTVLLLIMRKKQAQGMWH